MSRHRVMSSRSSSQNGRPTMAEKSGEATLTTRSNRPCPCAICSKTRATDGVVPVVALHRDSVPARCIDLRRGALEATQGIRRVLERARRQVDGGARGPDFEGHALADVLAGTGDQRHPPTERSPQGHPLFGL